MPASGPGSAYPVVPPATVEAWPGEPPVSGHFDAPARGTRLAT